MSTKIRFALKFLTSQCRCDLIFYWKKIIARIKGEDCSKVITDIFELVIIQPVILDC